MIIMRGIIPTVFSDSGDTALPLAEFRRLAERITTIPANFKPHQLVKKVYDDRAAMGKYDTVEGGSK
jgi:2-oxoglutarate dehydrogenase E1 component